MAQDVSCADAASCARRASSVCDLEYDLEYARQKGAHARIHSEARMNCAGFSRRRRLHPTSAAPIYPSNFDRALLRIRTVGRGSRARCIRTRTSSRNDDDDDDDSAAAEPRHQPQHRYGRVECRIRFLPQSSIFPAPPSSSWGARSVSPRATNGGGEAGGDSGGRIDSAANRGPIQGAPVWLARVERVGWNLNSFNSQHGQ
jgi:hypothetical protein